MGCCLSSSKKRHHNPPPDSARHGGAPPPPPLEEETVKEVLSETPILKPHIPKLLISDDGKDNDNDNNPKEVHEFPTEPTAVIKPCDGTKFESTDVIKPAPDNIVIPEVSEEISEMCSFTESYSTTATAAEKRDEDGEVTQRSPVRAHKKRRNTVELNRGRERNFRSPAGRSAPSPEKSRSTASSRSAAVQGRGMAAQRRNASGPSNGSTRRGPGENSGRRSNSPATRAPADTRRNVRSKSPVPVAIEGDKIEGGHSPERSVEDTCRSKTEKPKDQITPDSGESLENPLVSLECFIFL